MEEGHTQGDTLTTESVTCEYEREWSFECQRFATSHAASLVKSAIDAEWRSDQHR